MPWGTVTAAGGLAAAAGMAVRYARGRATAERDWLAHTEKRLSDVGEVEEVEILPLVERHTSRPGLRGEPGVSYLVRTPTTTMLFDCGLNPRRQRRSALINNAEKLGADLGSLDGVVLSHLHPDHVGGIHAQFRRTFAFSRDPVEPSGTPAYVPTAMAHDRMDAVPTTEPRVVAPGIALLPPLPRMLFWPGLIAEQAMVVNVRGFGLVLITGCGHPPVERMLGVAERVLDVPIRGVVGGLHLPVHPFGTPLVVQAVLGTPHPPWRLVNERDVDAIIDELEARGPRLVALSGHDSTDWTCDTFERRFGDRYRTLRVGEALHISAGEATPTAAGGAGLYSTTLAIAGDGEVTSPKRGEP